MKRQGETVGEGEEAERKEMDGRESGAKDRGDKTYKSTERKGMYLKEGMEERRRDIKSGIS